MMTTMGDIEETLDRFIQAFNKLQLDEMVACYNEDATAFFPVAHHHARLKGREAIRGTFERVLERIKASGATRARFPGCRVYQLEEGMCGSTFFHVEWLGDAVEEGLPLLRYVEDGRIAVSLNVESTDAYLSG